MKSLLSKSIVIVYCLIIISCNNNEGDKANNNNENNAEIASNSLSNDPEAKGQNKCLLNYQLKYDELLSEEDVLKATGFDKQKLTTEYNKFLKNPEYHGYRFSFENGRVGKIPGTDRVMKQSDYINVKYIEEMSLKSFQFNYRVPTDEDIKATQKILENVVDGKSKNNDVSDAVKDAEDKGVSKDQIKKTGSSIIGSMADIAKAYVDVEHLGDAAVWNTKSMELIVLKNGVKFNIEANVSNEMEHNREVAISLAKIILEKCK